jgi:DNA-binding beta-propeller fold protein YncE
VLGCGLLGGGIFSDLGGNDQCTVLHKSLGFGGLRGTGIAVNMGGDDRYVADTEHVKYSWFDNFGAQLSLSIGFGYGRRADMSDGHSWAGGFGLFTDGGGGNDYYRCGIFGIGCAYWYATGILYDDGGNDEYVSDSYAIAAPAHFGVGIVIDDGGNDIWRSKSSRACGFGRDFSLGWFEDGGGDDVYLCSDSAFGIGNVNGLGVCWDKGGNDTWVARSNSFGQPYVESDKTIRDFPINAGIFIDAAGADRYLKLPEGVDTWKLDPKRFDFAPHDFLRDGVRKSWRGHIAQPGSTGSAVDGSQP